MRDNRAVDEKLFSVIAEDGPMHDVVQFVKEHTELELCFRGNSGNGNINIYYKNLLAFRISGNKDKPVVKISANQGRYTQNWHEAYKKLGQDLSIKKVKGSYKIEQGDYVRIYSEKYDIEFWINAWNVLKPILDDYVSPAKEKSVDWYRKAYDDKQTGRAKDLKIEKQAQQRLFSKMCVYENGFYFYDLEYEQKGVKSKEKNKPDALAIEYIDGKAVSLVFVEVKSKKASIKGTSGLEKHLDGMYEYIQSVQQNGVIYNRIEEVKDIIAQYRQLGIRPVPPEFTKTDIERLEKNQKIMVILTDEVEKEYNSNPKFKNSINKQIKIVKEKKEINVLFSLESKL